VANLTASVSTESLNINSDGDMVTKKDGDLNDMEGNPSQKSARNSITYPAGFTEAFATLNVEPVDSKKKTLTSHIKALFSSSKTEEEPLDRTKPHFTTGSSSGTCSIPRTAENQISPVSPSNQEQEELIDKVPVS
jgi:hypothetical protein